MLRWTPFTHSALLHPYILYTYTRLRSYSRVAEMPHWHVKSENYEEGRRSLRRVRLANNAEAEFNEIIQFMYCIYSRRLSEAKGERFRPGVRMRARIRAFGIFTASQEHLANDNRYSLLIYCAIVLSLSAHTSFIVHEQGQLFNFSFKTNAKYSKFMGINILIKWCEISFHNLLYYSDLFL